MQPSGGSVPLAAGQGFAHPHDNAVRVPLASTEDLSGETPGPSPDPNYGSAHCVTWMCVGLGVS